MKFWQWEKGEKQYVYGKNTIFYKGAVATYTIIF